MQTIKGVDYPTNSKQQQEFLFHRGPGSTRFMIKAIAQSLRDGLRVYILCNSTYTKIVLQGLHHLSANFLTERAAAPAKAVSAFSFGPYDFSQTVGLWLKERQAEGRNYLTPFISVDSFEFTPDEFLELRERLELTIRKNNRSTTVSNALEDLNTGFFRHQTLEESQAFIHQRLEAFLQRANELRRRFLVAINSHARRAVFRQRNRLYQRTKALEEMLVLRRDLSSLVGRPAREQQQILKKLWAAYQSKWVGSEEMPAAVPDEAVLLQEQHQLAVERDNLSRTLAAANLSLSHVTVDPALGDPAMFLELAERLEHLIQDIDESGLYQLPLGGGTAATASRQLQRLESVLQRLNNSYLHLPELPAFYESRHFWYAQPARLRRLLAPLQDIPPTAWLPAFSSWYFDRCLEQDANPMASAFNCQALAEWLRKTETTSPKSVVPQQPVFLPPGSLVPADAEVLADFTGAGPPENFAGKYLGKTNLTNTAAQHHALAGIVDARLVLQQPFVPLQPPAWAPVAAPQPPPGTAGQLSVQLADEQSWEPLTSWDGQLTEHLRIYLPEKFTPTAGACFLACFEDLLNLTTTLTIFHDWSPAAITQALLSDGLNPAFLMAALLRAAEACSEVPYDQDALVAVGKEIRWRCSIADPAPNELAERMRALLQEQLPNYFFTLHQPWRDTFLPLVVLSPSGKKTVLLPGGRLPGQSDKYTEALRQRELTMAGLHCLEINAYACWEDVDAEVGRLVTALL